MRILSVILFLLSTALAFASEPILVIDSGGHRSQITDLVFTSDGRFLVSASRDKSVRVWDTVSGKTVRKILGQIGQGLEGALTSAALSSDDKILALTGFFPENEIRVVDFKSGKIISLLKGHTDTVTDLKFSPDRRFIASCALDNTVRIWDVTSFVQVHVLNGHTDEIYSVSFSPNGERLVSASRDGTFKVWDVKNGTLLKTYTPKASHQLMDPIAAYEAVFTPDGQKIIVSHSEAISIVDLHSGAVIKDLPWQYEDAIKIALSPDGNKLVTGSFGASRGSATNRVISLKGDVLLSFSEHLNDIFAVTISPDGKTVATGDSENGVIYLWDINTCKVQNKLAGQGGTIWEVGFSKDGRRIAWGKREPIIGRGPLKYTFRLITETGKFAPALGPTLKTDKSFIREVTSFGPWAMKPRGHIATHGVQAGVDDRSLLLLENGEAKYEITVNNGLSSFTFSADGSKAVYGDAAGTISSVNYLSGGRGEPFFGHTSAVRSLAASSDGRYIVSGSSDMTVRLWETATARLLLSIFHGVDNEWVAWTPEGYYVASNYGDKYIGWHINNGNDRAADYYSAQQFERVLYRPDYVTAYLASSGDKVRVASILNQELFNISNLKDIAPSKVTVNYPDYGSRVKNQMRLNFTIDAKVLETLNYSIFVNNIPITTTLERTLSGAERKSVTKNVDVILFRDRNEIRIEAFNGKSMGVFETVVYATDPVNMIGRGALHILSVGVNHFEKMPENDLEYAVADANKITQAFHEKGRKVFSQIFNQTISDQTEIKPTKTAILAEMNMFRYASAEDTSIIFLASHGISDAAGNYYFVPGDADPSDINRLVAMSAKGMPTSRHDVPSLISWEVFYDCLRQIPGRRILVVDTCQAKNIAGNFDVHSLAKRSASSAFALLVASKGEESSQEYPQGHQGLFTYALLDALAHGDENLNGEVTLSEMFSEISKFVENQRDRRLGPQTPQLISPQELKDTVLSGSL